MDTIDFQLINILDLFQVIFSANEGRILVSITVLKFFTHLS